VDAEVFDARRAGGGEEPDPLHDRDRPDAPHRVRKFGFVALVAAPLFWAVFRWFWDAPRAALWIGAVVLAWGALSAAAPVAAAPLLRGWMLVTRPVGVVTTTIILGAVFYLVITPLALVRRIGNRDPLDVRWSPSRGASAWKAKVLPPPDSPRWYRPF
jgi:hypothetical protein